MRFTELADNFITILPCSFEIADLLAGFAVDRGKARSSRVFAADLLTCVADLMSLDAVSCGN